MIHGAGGSSKTWKHQVTGLKDHFKILILDLRDHGASKNVIPAANHYNFELISKDIKMVLDQEEIAEAYFLTLSFGSVLLQAFSMQYPGIVSKAVIAGGIFKGNLAIRSFVHLARFFNLFLPYSKMYGIFSYLLMPKKRNQIARRIYQIQSAKITQEEYLKWIGLYGEFFRLLSSFYHQEVPFPSLVVMGTDDYIFLKSARNFSKSKANVELAELEKKGHICNIEAPEAFNDLTMSFLLQTKEKTQNKDQRPLDSSYPVG